MFQKCIKSKIKTTAGLMLQASSLMLSADFFCFIDIKLPWRHLLQITVIYTYMKSTSTLNEQFKFSDMSVCLVVTQQVCFDVFAYIQSPTATLIWTLTSRRKSSSRSRSRRSRMSACRHSSELHRRFCRTVRVRFPVS